MSSQILEIMDQLESLRKRVHTLEQLSPEKLDQNSQDLVNSIKEKLSRSGPGLKSIIIHSPGPSGKSYYRTDFANFFKCWPIIEDWSPGKEIFSGALHLSNTPMENPPDCVIQMTFTEACSISGIDPLRPAESLQD